MNLAVHRGRPRETFAENSPPNLGGLVDENEYLNH